MAASLFGRSSGCPHRLERVLSVAGRIIGVHCRDCGYAEDTATQAAREVKAQQAAALVERRCECGAIYWHRTDSPRPVCCGACKQRQRRRGGAHGRKRLGELRSCEGCEYEEQASEAARGTGTILA